MPEGDALPPALLLSFFLAFLDLAQAVSICMFVSITSPQSGQAGLTHKPFIPGSEWTCLGVKAL